MPAAPTKTKGPKCTLCSRVFRTKAALVQHSLSTGHNADRCCEPCARLFGTKDGLDAHMKSSVHTKCPVHTKSSSSGPPKKSSKVVAPTAPPVITKQPKCAVCNQLFQTKAQLVQHSLDSGHGEDRCCRPCHRLFGTKEALEAHRKTLICTRTARQDAQSSTSQVPQQNLPLICRGNSYRRIPQQDQFGILQKLLSRCHPRSALQRHGYSIPGAGSDQEQSGSPGRAQATGYETLPLRQNDGSCRTRKAVVLDCEMVGVAGGASELVSLTAVDFLTGELLLNSLVHPRQPVIDWRTQIHGISPAGLSVARAQGLALDGWQAATAELFKHVDQDTVLIGQSLQYDLAALHIRHARVVDSAILASEAVFGTKGKPRYWNLGLKNLCSELLGLNIREGAPLGVSKVHDGLEDVLATREVVLYWLEQPTAVKTWAKGKRNGFWRAPGKSRKGRRGKTRARSQQEDPWAKYQRYDDSEYMSDEEVLRWEDVIDYEMWPKSP